jgi:recombination protein RecA
MTERDREEALELALAQIERQFGKGAVMRLGDNVRVPVGIIPTGSIALDVALGIGGLPRGRVVEIYGPESSGKTTVALHAVANAQAAGGTAAFIDAEYALDPEYAKALGVDTDNLLIAQADSGEQALEITDMLIRSGALDIIVIDSVAALVPRAEIEGEMGESHVGLQARLMSQALRKLAGAVSTSKTTLIFINQLREKIGVLFGSPETTTGGRALRFYASVRLDIRRIETLKDGSDAVGNRTRVKVVKNKCLAEGTRVFDPSTGSTHRIEDIVDRRLAVQVAAADKAGVLHVRPVVRWFDQGEQDVVGLRLRDGTDLWMTPDHEVLTERGWAPAGDLGPGHRVARPREFLGFGQAQPVSSAHARMLGYLIGDGHVGGMTPIGSSNVAAEPHADAARIAAGLGCEAARRPNGIEVSFWHRKGEKNGLLEMCRSAGIWGKPAWEKQIPAAFFAPDVSAEVVASMLFGLFETDGWVGQEQTRRIRLGYAIASEQLANQIHWLLLRWGISSSVRRRDPRAQRGGQFSGTQVCWEVRVSGIDNVSAFADAIPTWGPRGQMLIGALAAVDGRLRRSQRTYLPSAVTAPVVTHLRTRGVSAAAAARLIVENAGDPPGGVRQVLGTSRLWRDHLESLADALDDAFLRNVLADQLSYAAVHEVLPSRRSRTFDVEVDELHNLVADGVVVHNCAPPFKQAEFDILYGHGISREGSLIDVGVEQGIVRKSGAWYTHEGAQLGQGKENARKFLRDNPDVAAEIEKRITDKLGVGPELDAETRAGL